MTAIQFVDFKKSREKGDFLKTRIGHLGLNGGKNIFYFLQMVFKNENLVREIFSNILSLQVSNFKIKSLGAIQS